MSFFWSLKDRVRSLGILAKLKVEQLHWVTLSESKQMRLGQKASWAPGEVFQGCPSEWRPQGRPRTQWTGYISPLGFQSTGAGWRSRPLCCGCYPYDPNKQLDEKMRLGLPVKVKRWWNDSLRNVAELMKIHELHGQLASMSTIFGCHKLCYSLVDWIHHQWGTYIFSFAGGLSASTVL